MIKAFFIGGPWDGEQKCLESAIPRVDGLEQPWRIPLFEIFNDSKFIPQKRFYYFKSFLLPGDYKDRSFVYLYQDMKEGLLLRYLVEGYRRPNVV